MSTSVEGEQFYTIDEAIDRIGFGRWQWMLMAVVGLCWIADSMEMMLLSFLGPVVKCAWSLSPNEESMLTTVVFIGMLAGNYAWGFVGDRLGRKRSIFLCSLFIAIFGLLSAFATNIRLLSGTRFFVGFGSGGVHVAFAMFLEFIPSTRRGMWSTVMQGWWTVGTLFQAIMAMFIIPTLGWRYLVAFSSIPVFLFLFIVLFLQESPRFLLSAGNVEEAEQVLHRAAVMNGQTLPAGRLKPESPAAVPQILEDLTAVSPGLTDEPQDSGEMESSWNFDAYLEDSTRPKQSSYLQSVRKILFGRYRKVTFLLICIWLAASVIYYGLVLLTTAVQVVENGGCDPSDPQKVPLQQRDYVEVIITTLAEVPGLISSALLIDCMGRKNLLVLQFVVCSVASYSLLLAGRAAEITSLFISRAAIGGAFLVVYTYTPEIYSTSLRATAVGICVAASRIGGIIAPFLGQGLISYGKMQAAYIILGSMSLAGALACFLLQVYPQLHTVRPLGSAVANPALLVAQADTTNVSLSGQEDT